jgi:glutathione S-transferase
MAEVEIYSASVCPYAHRTRLALLEKGVDFKLTEIDLQNKPEWFADVSPYGKVPVINRVAIASGNPLLPFTVAISLFGRFL